MPRKLNPFFYIGVCLIVVILSGCARSAQWTPPAAPTGYHPIDVSKLKDPIPRVEPRDKYANSPYVVRGHRYIVLKNLRSYKEEGFATWYGNELAHHRTATKDRFDPYQMTAAHRTLPLPCYAKVTNLKTGRQVIVRVNDRGPFVSTRLIDLSYASALKLGIVGSRDMGWVSVEAIDPASQHVSPLAPYNSELAKHPKRHIMLQLRTVSTLPLAQQFARQVNQSSKYTCHIEAESIAKQKRYRVSVGSFTTAQQAEIAMNHLMRAGLRPMIVMQ